MTKRAPSKMGPSCNDLPSDQEHDHGHSDSAESKQPDKSNASSPVPVQPSRVLPDGASQSTVQASEASENPEDKVLDTNPEDESDDLSCPLKSSETDQRVETRQETLPDTPRATPGSSTAPASTVHPHPGPATPSVKTRGHHSQLGGTPSEPSTPGTPSEPSTPGTHTTPGPVDAGSPRTRRWTRKELKTLLWLLKHNPKWSWDELAERMPGRTAEDCKLQIDELRKGNGPKWAVRRFK